MVQQGQCQADKRQQVQTGTREMVFEEKTQPFPCEDGQTLDHAAQVGCTETPHLSRALLSHCPSSEPSQAPLAMGAAPRGALGTSLGGLQAVPRQGRGMQIPVAVGCQCGELLPHQLQPSLGCSGHCQLSPVPRPQHSTGLVSPGSSMRFDLFSRIFFPSGLFMKLEQSFICDFLSR